MGSGWSVHLTVGPASLVNAVLTGLLGQGRLERRKSMWFGGLLL